MNISGFFYHVKCNYLYDILIWYFPPSYHFIINLKFNDIILIPWIISMNF